MHRAGINFALLIAVAFLSGCKATMCMESKRGLQRFSGDERPVFVTNPEMRKEYEILRASKIYHLSDQTDDARKLTLRPIQPLGGCGTALFLTFFTLGIVPGVGSEGCLFHYDLETDGLETQHMHSLRTYSRVSIWEWFLTDRHREDRVLAEALAWSQIEPRPIGL